MCGINSQEENPEKELQCPSTHTHTFPASRDYSEYDEEERRRKNPNTEKKDGRKVTSFDFVARECAGLPGVYIYIYIYGNVYTCRHANTGTALWFFA